MNKGIISIIVAVVLLISSIISGALFFGCSKAPDGLSALEGVLNGCNNKSEKEIVKNFISADYLSSFSSCVTPDDYLKKCGIRFDYMYDEENITEKFYLVGTAAESDDVTELNSIMSTASLDYKMIEAYIAADYKDANGNERTAMTTVVLTVNDGKILYIV